MPVFPSNVTNSSLYPLFFTRLPGMGDEEVSIQATGIHHQGPTWKTSGSRQTGQVENTTSTGCVLSYSYYGIFTLLFTIHFWDVSKYVVF